MPSVIKAFLGIVLISCVIHFSIYMAAYYNNLRYANILAYRFKHMTVRGFKSILIMPKNTLPLLTIEGELWAILHFGFDIVLIFCGYLAGIVTSTNVIPVFAVIWLVLEVLFLFLSFWIHYATNEVIKLSKEAIISDAAFEQHIRSKLRSARKTYPQPQYSTNTSVVEHKSLFWKHESWYITVSDTYTLEIVLEKIVAKRDWYRYYDAPLTQLIERFSPVNTHKSC